MNNIKVCEKCGRQNFNVVDTRYINGMIIRRRVCRSCNRAQYSKEVPIDYVEGLDIMREYHKVRRIKDGRNNKA